MSLVGYRPPTSAKMRFWLFGGEENAYANGGVGDLVDWYETEAEAIQAAFTVYPLHWFHVVDMEWRVVTCSHNAPVVGDVPVVGAVTPRKQDL